MSSVNLLNLNHFMQIFNEHEFIEADSLLEEHNITPLTLDGEPFINTDDAKKLKNIIYQKRSFKEVTISSNEDTLIEFIPSESNNYLEKQLLNLSRENILLERKITHLQEILTLAITDYESLSQRK